MVFSDLCFGIDELQAECLKKGVRYGDLMLVEGIILPLKAENTDTEYPMWFKIYL